MVKLNFHQWLLTFQCCLILQKSFKISEIYSTFLIINVEKKSRVLWWKKSLIKNSQRETSNNVKHILLTLNKVWNGCLNHSYSFNGKLYYSYYYITYIKRFNIFKLISKNGCLIEMIISLFRIMFNQFT